MKSIRTLVTVPAISAVVLSAWLSPDMTRAADYGSVTGQFVLDGAIPKPKLLFAKGDPDAKDGEVCAAADRYSNKLVIDAKTKGIADIFIYLRKAPEDIHPDLKRSKVKELTFDQVGCQFYPHSLFVRTDQAVRVLSDDPLGHNTHTYPIKNVPVNFLLRPKDRVGVLVTVKVSEILPIQVKCDIHPWMRSNWLILDHPYATITDKDGKFTIEKLPAGEHSFYVWHELVGYVDRKFKVTIPAGGTDAKDPVKVPLMRFEED